MSNNATSDYLVLSRGLWDKDARQEEIDASIVKFYEWYALNYEPIHQPANSDQ